MSDEQFLELVRLIYKASYEPKIWPEVLEIITQLTDSRSALLLYHDHDLSESSFMTSWGFPEKALEDYSNKYHQLNPFFKLNGKNPLGTVATESQLVPNRHELETICGEFYEDFMKPYDQYHVVGATLFNDQNKVAAVALQRGRSQGSWIAEEVNLLQDLVPDFQQALKIHNKFTRLVCNEKKYHSIIDDIFLGVIVLDKGQQVLHVNTMAKSIINDNPVLDLNNERLFITDKKSNSDFQAMLGRLFHNNKTKTGRSEVMGLRHPDMKFPLPLLAIAQQNTSQFSSSSSSEDDIVLYLSDPKQKNNLSVEVISAVFALTLSEAKVAMALANGHSMTEIAKENNLSIHTVRSYVKTIFEKTGTHQQHAGVIN